MFSNKSGATIEPGKLDHPFRIYSFLEGPLRWHTATHYRSKS